MGDVKDQEPLITIGILPLSAEVTAGKPIIVATEADKAYTDWFVARSAISWLVK